jgi:hypothetical protein
MRNLFHIHLATFFWDKGSACSAVPGGSCMQQGTKNLFSGQNIKILSSKQQGIENLFSRQKIKILQHEVPVVSTATHGKDDDFDAGEFSGYIPFIPFTCKLPMQVHELSYSLVSSIMLLLNHLFTFLFMNVVFQILIMASISKPQILCCPYPGFNFLCFKL